MHWNLHSGRLHQQNILIPSATTTKGDHTRQKNYGRHSFCLQGICAWAEKTEVTPEIIWDGSFCGMDLFSDHWFHLDTSVSLPFRHHFPTTTTISKLPECLTGFKHQPLGRYQACGRSWTSAEWIITCTLWSRAGQRTDTRPVNEEPWALSMCSWPTVWPWLKGHSLPAHVFIE